MKATAKKIVQVLATYKFKNIARICFTVLSSKGTEKYNTCFDGSADKGSCTCPSQSPKGCYHLDQLRPVAQAYFESRKEAARKAASKPVATVKIDGQVLEVTANVETGKITSTPCKGEAVVADKAATFAGLFKKFDCRQAEKVKAERIKITVSGYTRDGWVSESKGWQSQVDAIMAGQSIKAAPGAFCLAR